MIYVEQMPKEERKKYGQFFTSKETAIFMANLFDLPPKKETLKILDAGAGSGILIGALIDYLNKHRHLKKIDVVCYENDEKILSLLDNNLKFCKEHSKATLSYQILKENYITSQSIAFNEGITVTPEPIKFDLIIGNPPYKKISKNADEAKFMPSVCYGAPNLYFLFAAMSVFNLSQESEMVYIIPRSWTSGAYFEKFRQYFLSECRIKHIHLFISRNKVFDKENVLQETMIIKVQKTRSTLQHVKITTSNSNKDFEKITSITVPYNLVVSGERKYVYLATTQEDVEILQKMKKWKQNLPSIGLKMRTGITVDFRNRNLLRDTEVDGAVPLFYAQHIQNGLVTFPIHKEREYIVPIQAGLIQDNKNYLFIKRFTAKEEKRRLQCGIYLKDLYPQYKNISTQNMINFIEATNGVLSKDAVYGLYVLFNSTIYDKYYRILNGSTQVNSTEINTLPVPEFEMICQMGCKLLSSQDLSETNCNHILEGYCE